MSTEKGGSDLDVFNDLNPRTPEGEPVAESKKTLLGLQGTRGGLPPVPGTRSAPPPPPSSRGPVSQPRRSAVSLPPPRSSPVATSRITEDTPVGPPGGNLLAESARDAKSSPSVAPTPPSQAPAAQVEAPLKSSSSLDGWLTAQPGSVAPPPPEPSAPPVDAASLLSNTVVTTSTSSSSDVGWDDDDDKTTIYDKDTQSAAQALLQPPFGNGTMSGRPPPPMSRPPGAIMPPQGIVTRTTAPPVPRDATFSLPPPVYAPAMKSWQAYGMAAIVAICVGVLVFLLLPQKGSLTVTVAGPGNKPLEAVEIIVDGRVRCRASPCRVPDLKAGAHIVQARAAGYQSTAEMAVEVSGRQEAVHNVLLSRSLPTGLRVFGEGTGMTLLVDGREIGPLPQVLRDMEPGEHLVQVTGGEYFETFEQRVTVDPEHMKVIGPIKLRVAKGLVTIVQGSGAEGADVTLRAGSSRKTLPRLPVTLEIPTSQQHVVIARKPGYSTFQQEITFPDGEVKKTIEIVMNEERAPAPRPAAQSGEAPAALVAPASDAVVEAVDVASEGEAARTATLNLSSTPPSNVVLDGKPLGSTPHLGLTVPAGTHTVIFINGSERKRATVTAAPGSTKTVSVKFD